MDLSAMLPLACAGVGVIAFIVISLYFILLAMLRDPQGMRRLTSQKRMTQTETMRRTSDILRAPFDKEDQQLNELSDLVDSLSRPSTSHPSADQQPQTSFKK